MKDLSEQAQVMAAAETWRAKYEQPNGWAVRQDGTSAKDVYEALCALESNATAEDVALLTGDKSLVTRRQCQECGVRAWACVLVADRVVCMGCIYKAVGVLVGVVRP